jgi:hypothetical protein
VDDRGVQLVFECSFDQGVLSLCVWKPDGTPAALMIRAFSWDGSNVEFRKAVQGLTLMGSCARIFNVYRKGCIIMARLFVYTKDVQVLTGKGRTAAHRLIMAIKAELNKGRKDLVTVEEF